MTLNWHTQYLLTAIISLSTQSYTPSSAALKKSYMIGQAKIFYESSSKINFILSLFTCNVKHFRKSICTSHSTEQRNFRETQLLWQRPPTEQRVVKSTVCVQGQHNEFAHFGYPNIHRKGVIYLQDKYIYFWFISKLFRFRGLHPVLSLTKQLQESCLLLADCVNEKWKYWGFKTGSEFGRFVICTVKPNPNPKVIYIVLK